MSMFVRAIHQSYTNCCGPRPVDEPYVGGVTAEALRERIEGFAAGPAQIRPVEQDYAPDVGSHEGPRSADDSIDGAGADIEREWPWVDVLPECDRRLFAEEMSQLLAEAAETDDLAEVEQALREWRVTSETYSDPELARRFSQPLRAHGGRVPRPAV